MKLPTLEEINTKAESTVFRLDGEFPHSVEYDADTKTIHFMWNEVDGDTCEAEMDEVVSFDPKIHAYHLRDVKDHSITYELKFYQTFDPFA